MRGMFTDLTGQRFGKLKVLKKVGKTKSGRILWLCQCECGNTVEVMANNLIEGRRISCSRGCSNLIDLTGKRFGKWTVLRRVYEKGHSPTRYLCRCDCGTEKSVAAQTLMTGKSKSCGCLPKRNDRNGKSCSRLYRVWSEIKRICHKDYVSRGITVCEEWLDFQNFYDWAIENGYNEELLSGNKNMFRITRIDKNGNYEPSNCYVGILGNYRGSKTHVKLYEFNGETLSLSEIEKRYNIPHSTLIYRLKNGMSIKEAIETQKTNATRYCEYNGKHYTLFEISKIYNISKMSLYNRLQRGISLTEAIKTLIKKTQKKDIII